MIKRKDVAPIQYYNSLKTTITKEKMKNGMVVKNLPENLRKLLLFCALKKRCYVENIVEIALRDYFSKDKTIAPFLDCNFEVDFSESFNIRKVDNLVEVKK
jgi:hypothetical protein